MQYPKIKGAVVLPEYDINPKMLQCRGMSLHKQPRYKGAKMPEILSLSRGIRLSKKWLAGGLCSWEWFLLTVEEHAGQRRV